MRARIRRAATLGAIAASIVAACGDDAASNAAAATTVSTIHADTTIAAAAPTTTATPPTTAAPPTTETPMDDGTGCGAVALRLDVAALPELAGGAHYEAWAIIEEMRVSTGKFLVENGTAVSFDGAPVECFNVDGLETATQLVITIEPRGDTDVVPADTHLVAGDVINKGATLTVDHPAALGTDFSDAAGTFLLATPTDGNNTNELSGIWFLEVPGPNPSLVLPQLPPGWVYEGWAVIDGVPVTSGTFLQATGFDDFDGFSGDQGGPPFPGEDYLKNAPPGLTFPTDLTGATVVVSVEPSPDDSPAPFAIKPLTGNADDPAADHVSYRLENAITELPTVTAVIG